MDLDNRVQVDGTLAGADAAIHLATIPSLLGHPPEVVFRNNVLAQFNVFEVTGGGCHVVSALSRESMT